MERKRVPVRYDIRVHLVPADALGNQQLITQVFVWKPIESVGHCTSTRFWSARAVAVQMLPDAYKTYINTSK